MQKKQILFVATFVGMIPLLMVAITVQASLVMGVLSACIMLCCVIVAWFLRKVFSEHFLWPVQIIVLPTLVSIAYLVMQAFFIEWSEAFGIYIPLLAANFAILCQVDYVVNLEDGFGKSFLRSILIAILWIAILFLVGSVREIMSMRTWFGITILPETINSVAVMGLPAGGLLVLGFIAAFVQRLMPDKASDIETEKEEDVL